MVMKACFKHAERAADTSCPYCSKDYCEDCLLQVGKRKNVICEDCYNHSYSKIKRSTMIRYVYLVVGFLLIIPIILSLLGFIETGNQNEKLFLVLGFGVLLSIIMNTLRLVQFRDWRITEKYDTTSVE